MFDYLGKTDGKDVFRYADKVYLVDLQAISPFQDMRRSLQKHADLVCLAMHEYRCPFSILKEFDQWFEWHRRLRFEREKTGRIIISMLENVDRIKAHRVERTPTYFWPDCLTVPRRRSFLASIS